MLFSRYFPPEWPLDARQERAQEAYGFTCDCALCKLDSKDSLRKQRDHLLARIDTKALSGDGVSLNETLSDLQRVRKTYTSRDEYRFGLVTPLQMLGDKYCQQLEYRKALKCFEEIFELLKEHNDFQAMLTLRKILACHLSYNNNRQKSLEMCKKRTCEYFESMHFCRVFYEAIWQRLSGEDGK